MAAKNNELRVRAEGDGDMGPQGWRFGIQSNDRQEADANARNIAW